MLLEELRGEAESTAAKKTLARVELVNTTPALVGSWDATGYARCSCSGSCHPDLCVAEPPRPTDIAGKTRWWLRAILAAGYYEAHKGFPSLDKLDQLASKILGSTREASRYTIVVEAYTPRRVRIPSTIMGDPQRCSETTSRLLAEQCCSPSSDSAYVLEDCASEAASSRRARLAILGHMGAERTRRLPLPPGFYRFRLRVEERPLAQRNRDHGLRELEQRLLGTALAMALFFTGIGRMVTRGYGKLAPLAWSNTETPLEEAMRNVWYTLVNTHSFEGLVEIARDASTTAQGYLRMMESHHSSSSPNNPLPDYPVLHKEFICGDVVQFDNISVWEVLRLINDSTRLRAIDCRYYKRYFAGPCATLGLPRKNLTARIAGRSLSRLQSPLVLVPLLNPNNSNISLRRIHVYITLYKYTYPIKINTYTMTRKIIKSFIIDIVEDCLDSFLSSNSNI